ncbi:MAG: FtsX-like permease family protein [Spirochaetales bacterium]|nr:FtsX-like permease family protein [Spirochaetales bacterium]
MVESGSGMKESYVQNFTGDLILKAPTIMDVSLFGPTTPSLEDFYIMPEITEKDRILTILDNRDDINQYTGLLYGAARMEISKEKYNVPVFGIEGDSYFSMFPDTSILKGYRLETGKQGLMITGERYRDLLESGRSVEIGDSVELKMAGRNGFRIREVELVGIFEYSQSNATLDDIVLCDMQTLADLNAMSVVLDQSEDISEDESSLLLLDDMDLFGDTLFGDDQFSDESGKEDILDNLFDDVIEISDANSMEKNQETGWQFILLRLDNAASTKSTVKDLSALFKIENLSVEILGWRSAAGFSAELVYLLRLIYNAGFLLVAFAGCIAMVNILLISVFDRTKEIGTLRAIGTQKTTIRSMILLENIILSTLGGVLGVFIGNLLLFYLNEKQIVISNSLLRFLLGEQFSVNGTVQLALFSVVISIVLGYFSSLYPIKHALSIPPSTAQNKGAY